eukprot:GDKJ01040452.1.p1 GENE.GDKJ01040452.1~~GDKJ01040452.1.p1  ORF type:complete len:161 (+),score=51.32 GDKJ01040452.1:25-507(+)
MDAAINLFLQKDFDAAIKAFKLLDQSDIAVRRWIRKCDCELKNNSRTVSSMDAPPAAPVVPSTTTENIKKYPSSKGPKNWDSLDKYAEKEAEEKVDGEAALNQLFQQIFSRGDENTRRAMIKSFQTSGGTVLSTNWDEVAKENYEEKKSAPDGQEFKKWN